MGVPAAKRGGDKGLGCSCFGDYIVRLDLFISQTQSFGLQHIARRWSRCT